MCVVTQFSPIYNTYIHTGKYCKNMEKTEHKRLFCALTHTNVRRIR